MFTAAGRCRARRSPTSCQRHRGNRLACKQLRIAAPVSALLALRDSAVESRSRKRLDPDAALRNPTSRQLFNTLLEARPETLAAPVISDRGASFGASTAPGWAVCRTSQARRLDGVDAPSWHDIRPIRTRPALTGVPGRTSSSVLNN